MGFIDENKLNKTEEYLSEFPKRPIISEHAKIMPNINSIEVCNN